MDFADHPLTTLGAAAALVAALAWWGDHRRLRRQDPDAVGWMPWTTVFFFATFTGAVLLVLGVEEWI